MPAEKSSEGRKGSTCIRAGSALGFLKLSPMFECKHARYLGKAVAREISETRGISTLPQRNTYEERGAVFLGVFGSWVLLS